jgi:hypothetical protein
MVKVTKPAYFPEIVILDKEKPPLKEEQKTFSVPKQVLERWQMSSNLPRTPHTKGYIKEKLSLLKITKDAEHASKFKEIKSRAFENKERREKINAPGTAASRGGSFNKENIPRVAELAQPKRRFRDRDTFGVQTVRALSGTYLLSTPPKRFQPQSTHEKFDPIHNGTSIFLGKEKEISEKSFTRQRHEELLKQGICQSNPSLNNGKGSLTKQQIATGNRDFILNSRIAHIKDRAGFKKIEEIYKNRGKPVSLANLSEEAKVDLQEEIQARREEGAIPKKGDWIVVRLLKMFDFSRP